MSDYLLKPVPNDTLVFLRIAMGLLGGGDILGNGIYYHWYKDEFSGFTFPYLGFTWVQPLPEPFLSLFFVVGFLLGLAVAVGWRFRWTAPLFALAFTYLFLLEKAHYLNHAYLFTWLAWLLCFTPAWRKLSFDSRRQPKERSDVAPAWSVFIFPLLMGIVYFYGGVAKINHDWLLEGMPMKMWLARRADMPLLGPLWAQEATAYAMSWGGMLLDLSVPFLLLHRRLRWLALALLAVFHATNHLIFNIGIFPYLSMVLTSLFFAPDWPKRLTDWLATSQRVPTWARTQVQRWKQQSKAVTPTPTPTSTPTSTPYWQFQARYLKPMVGVGALLIAVHLLLPWRHWAFPSDVAWSEAGHRYSWRMMLRSKQGRGHFRIVDRQTGQTEKVYPKDSLSRRQYQKMATHPDMILQYAHHLRDQRQAQGQAVAVYANFRCRLNGRKYQTFVDENTDLATTEWTWFGDKEWVLAE